MSPEKLFCVQERERLVYELRRHLKTMSVKYQFLHDPPEGAIALVLRDSWPKSWGSSVASKLGELQFSQINPNKFFRTIQSGGRTATVVVHIGADLCRPNLPGPVLLISTQ